MGKLNRMRSSWKENVNKMANIPYKKNIWKIVSWLVFAAIVYFLLQETNIRCFQKQKRIAEELKKNIVEAIRGKLVSLKVKESCDITEVKNIWKISVEKACDITSI